MNITIIEDKSPYYVRYTHDGIDNILDMCKNIEVTDPASTWVPKFTNSNIGIDNSLAISRIVPKFKELELYEARISLFISEPGTYYPPHRDGVDLKFGVNYCVHIKDDKCITKWYTDESLNGYEKIQLTRRTALGKKFVCSRELKDFKRHDVPHIESIVAKEGEAILFNTEIFHDWDNTESDNTRIVLTLRPISYSYKYFHDARKILFGY